MATRKRRRDKGTGSIYQRGDGKWEAALSINGKLRRRVAADRAGAEARLAELSALSAAQIDVDSGQQTVGAWLQSYYAHKVRQELRRKTLASERRVIELYLLPRLESIRLDRLTRADIQRCLDDIRADIRAHTPHDGTRTVQLCARVIRQVCAMAVRRRALPHTPYVDIVLPRVRPSVVEPLDDDALQRLLTVCAADDRAALWYLYALLGLRRGEGLGLMWSDIDWQQRTVTIRRQVQVDERGVYLEEPKTAAGVRVLPLIDPLPQLLSARWERTKAPGLVFASAAGTPLDPSNVNRWFIALRRQARVSVTLHQLRHGVATMLAEVPVSELIIAAVLGHGDATITARYTHPRVQAMRTALSAVAARAGATTAARQTGT